VGGHELFEFIRKIDRASEHRSATAVNSVTVDRLHRRCANIGMRGEAEIIL
jgi:hypothetical protein